MRFGLIVSVIQETYTDASASAYCRRVSQTPQTLPDILYGGEHYPLRLTDWVANGKTKRSPAMAIDYVKEGMGDVH